MTDFPAWMEPFAADLETAAELGFTEWTYNDDDPAAAQGAFSIREGADHVDHLMVFRHTPGACLSFRHRSGTQGWWQEPQAVAAGAQTAERKTPYRSLREVLADVATWPEEP
jgi:hypothetical protein